MNPHDRESSLEGETSYDKFHRATEPLRRILDEDRKRVLRKRLARYLLIITGSTVVGFIGGFIGIDVKVTVTAATAITAVLLIIEGLQYGSTAKPEWGSSRPGELLAWFRQRESTEVALGAAATAAESLAHAIASQQQPQNSQQSRTIDPREKAAQALASHFQSLIRRLSDTVEALGFRANVNLAIGIVITAAGLIALFVYVNNQPVLTVGELPWKFVAHFVPRLTLVLLVEVFAYFFLNLYKSNLSEMKFFQNELTNIEVKALAFFGSVHFGNESTPAAVLAKLADTERNYLLRKDESTPELKRMEIERAGAAEILKEISSIVKARVPGGAKGDERD